MLSLLAKIFLAYWLAAGVVIIIADLQPHKLIHTPELSDALDTALAMSGHSLLIAYRSNQCGSSPEWQQRKLDAMSLVSTDGRRLCGDLDTQQLSKLISNAVYTNKRVSEDFFRYQVVATPLVAADGGDYILLMRSGYSSAMQVYGFLPGVRMWETSVVVTFFLAILIVLPLRRLRAATRRVADGHLDTRISSDTLSRALARFGMNDDIEGLVRDFNGMGDRLQTLVNGHKLLLRDVSHELRSPLARLAVVLELARDVPANADPARMKTHLDRIERESLRLNSLIGHILSFSYIDSIRDLHHSSELSLVSLVEELLPDVQYEAEKRNCRIITSAPHDCIVNGDFDMLRHAVENIVRNAIRYSPAGGTVRIDLASQKTGDCAYAVLRIFDAGPGVPEDKLNLILNPFYRTGDTRRGNSSGFGVGLAIADRAAHLHAGQIVARNRIEGGLEVEMSLPLANAIS